MLNPRTFYNSRPDGFGVLEIADPDLKPNTPRRFVPLTRTDLTGTVTGPLASLTLTQTFSLAADTGAVIEALYRFPLPGDAAVTGVRVRFGDDTVQTLLKERETAEADFKQAKQTGRQAALVTRESPDVFTLAVAGIRPGQEVVVQTDYVQAARPEGAGWGLRVPLTTAPRYVRGDETNGRHAAGQPLAIMRDPGHRFVLDLAFGDADRITSPTHTLTVDGGRVRLRDGEVIPDRDCVLTWQAAAEDSRPALRVWTHTDTLSGQVYFLALCAPPKFASAKKVPREVILLVDHSGSMEGAKWEAADWAVERFLAGLNESDAFALGLFHNTTKWLAERTRRATPETVREAVGFLKSNRDSGGTELGVALEQALDRARSADTPARHVLILTDAEVSDSGRILRLADAEYAKANRRRVSVLCIDAAPNAALATELAERGGGVARFLTSNPDEDDVTTALDEVLADWSAPVLTGLTLEVNRTGAESIGRTVTTVVPGPASAIDVGDLPAGRPVWVVGRVPAGGDQLSFRLRTGAEIVAEVRPESKITSSGLKALFGADRVRRLEYVMNANFGGDELRAELARLGYEAPAGETKVYAENARHAGAKVVRQLLVRESLAAGVPCSETAFVAVRSEVGQPVTETRVIANALPAGWQEPGGGAAVAMSCLMAPPSGVGGSLGRKRSGPAKGAFGPPPAAPPVSGELTDEDFDDEFEDDEFDDDESAPAACLDELEDVEFAADASNTTTDFDPLAGGPAKAEAPAPPPAKDYARIARGGGVRGPGSAAPVPAPARGIRIAIAAGQHASGDGAVLFGWAGAAAGQFTFLSVAFADKGITADTIDPELTLLLFVGDLAAPRARVKLADILRLGGRRPLNIRREANETVRLTLADPSGAWKNGVPALEVVLG
jgi:Ca-activated chloride channel family protein